MRSARPRAVSAYLIRRVLIAIPVMLGITIIAFTAISLAPGDPITSRLDPSVLSTLSPGEIDARRAALGLNDPLPIRYAVWLGGVLRGDLGFSAISKRPVLEEISVRVGPTLLLMVTSLTIATIFGITMGVLAAVRRYTPFDYVLTAVSMGMIVIPGFVIGLGFIYVFGIGLRLFPVSGMVTPGSGGGSVQDVLAHLAMPATILGLALGAQVMRYTRASMLDVLSADYITTARAKGVRARWVVLRHALRNALMPVITVIGTALPDAVGGAVITEQVFGWPGMGRLAVKAANDRDATVMMGVVLLFAVAVIGANILTDMAYAAADPRIRLGKRA